MPALLLIAVYITGFSLSRPERPYGTLVLTVHTVALVAAVLILGVIRLGVARRAGLGRVKLVVTVITGLLFLSAIVTGVLLAVGEPAPVLLVLHRVTSILVAFSATINLYQLRLADPAAQQ